MRRLLHFEVVISHCLLATFDSSSSSHRVNSADFSRLERLEDSGLILGLTVSIEPSVGRREAKEATSCHSCGVGTCLRSRQSYRYYRVLPTLPGTREWQPAGLTVVVDWCGAAPHHGPFLAGSRSQFNDPSSPRRHWYFTHREPDRPPDRSNKSALTRHWWFQSRHRLHTTERSLPRADEPAREALTPPAYRRRPARQVPRPA